MIRTFALQYFEDEGFEALAAGTVGEAIQILERRNDVRVVFTDIDLPGSMDGLMLARAVQDRWPPIHIFVTSGYRRPTKEELPSDARFFMKPYNAAHLAQAFWNVCA
jgi:CheY-like chemotaxis protein